MEVSPADQEPEQAHAKKVSFRLSSFPPAETDLGESARLLEHHALSSFPDPEPSSSSSGHGVARVSPFLSAPPTQEVTAAPTSRTAASYNLETPPSCIDEWPNATMRIPCTHCGHYIETTMSEETEYMGCKACFVGKPVFRRSYVHYCPNCGEAIGFHYTGEDCFCNHQRSTMTFNNVLVAACACPGCCE